MLSKEKTYEQLRAESDRSIPEAKKIISKFLFENIEPTTVYDDMTKCIDLVFEARKVVFAHRCRKDNGRPIDDVTIKTGSMYGEQTWSGKQILVEFDKLINYDFANVTDMYYFYCQFNYDLNKITKYIIYDLKKLSLNESFKKRELFIYSEDKINKVDGGSKFNAISVKTLRDLGLVIIEYPMKVESMKYVQNSTYVELPF
jgi:hypothetical protein